MAYSVKRRSCESILEFVNNSTYIFGKMGNVDNNHTKSGFGVNMVSSPDPGIDVVFQYYI